MPNRIIKESICTSEEVEKLSWLEEAFFYRLMVNCDDYGRFDARTAIIKSRLFPLKNIGEEQMGTCLERLQQVGLVRLYTWEGKPYVQLATWDKHQRIRAKKSKYPPPDGVCGQERADAPVIQPESKSQSEYQSKEQFKAPSAEEVAKYCLERGNGIDGEEFCRYYAARGWMVGSSMMRDWRAAVCSWERRRKPAGQGGSTISRLLERGEFDDKA